jgi:tRNA A-37 threonylcarbamoyl transferase component Bud32
VSKRTDKDWLTPVPPTPPGTPPKGDPAPAPMPAAPRHKSGASRVDTLPEDFVKLLNTGPLTIGDVIAGRYKLMERLGDGAMGQVFVAENLAIGRRVAVKVLKTELLADPSFRQRFQHEAEAIAAIEHRNVARFLDLVVGDPTFLVMEYVRGPTLDDLLEKEKKLDTRRAIEVTKRLCWALEAAHQAGVIHRDIKPSNVILSPDLETGEEPKLIDFGLAKLAHAAVKAGLTRTGQIVGTPEYMAPEQIANKPVDARSDVYALGCLFYELLTGRPPFEGNDDVQVLYQQLHDNPQPIEKLLPNAVKELKNVMTRALAKKPEDRFQSMREMAMALEGVPDEKHDGDETSPRFQTQRVKLPPRFTPRIMRLMALAGVACLGIGFGAAKLIGRSGGGGTALLLVSTPGGAAIELDGKPLEESTPTTVRGLPPGSHSVKMRKGKMAVVERQLTLAAGERAVMNVVLPPASHQVEVHSAPEGASVYLDGKLAVDETPTMVEVSDDEFHELLVQKNGFETAMKALTPDDHDPTLRVSLTPEKQPRGTLMVDSNGAAEVWLDGVDSGYTTPTLGIHVPAGLHTVEVRDGANGKVSAKVKIEQGQTLRLLLSPGGTKTP